MSSQEETACREPEFSTNRDIKKTFISNTKGEGKEGLHSLIPSLS
jgi:hypothetical protein